MAAKKTPFHIFEKLKMLRFAATPFADRGLSSACDEKP